MYQSFRREGIICRYLKSFKLTFTSSYSTIETIEKGILTIKTHQKHVNDVFMVFLLLTLNLFHNFFSVSIVDFDK